MNLHDVNKGIHKHKRRLRIGRGPGSGRGKTSGRGHKGQGQLAGWSAHPVFEGARMPLVRRIPKRGFNNRWGATVASINVGRLDAVFAAGEEVSPESLRARGIVKERVRLSQDPRQWGPDQKAEDLGPHVQQVGPREDRAVGRRGARVGVAGPGRETVEEGTRRGEEEVDLHTDDSRDGTKYRTERVMFEKIRVVFTIPELRQKILLTLLFLAIYRVGWQIPLPIVDQAKMQQVFQTGGGGIGDLLNTVAMFSATKLNIITIFGLGIMPYISASIIFQLLGSVWGPLEQLQKEGESGRKKINEYTRYATVVICLLQCWLYVGQFLISRDLIDPRFYSDPATKTVSWWWIFVTVMTMTAGTIFLMWLGEQIDEFGIGNGISLLIMAGILSGMPGAVGELIKNSTWELGGGNGRSGPEVMLVLVVLFIGVVAGVVFITAGQRRIPTQSAKHVRGRKVYGGTRQYLPLRVNQAGVMPIIFASSLLLFPFMIFQWLESKTAVGGMWHKLWGGLHDAFNRQASLTYNLLYVALIYFFCYFWTAITFNPKEMADNLKNFGSFIPGYRPGRRTADHLEKVMVRITYVGAAFLALVAVTPTIVGNVMHIPPNVAAFFGGTGLLIVVSVAFDLVQKIDSHLVMRNYRGLLE